MKTVNCPLVLSTCHNWELLFTYSHRLLWFKKIRTPTTTALLIYRKGAIQMTEIKRPFLAAKAFNANLVQCLPPHYVIISNRHICSFTCRISHIHRCAPKTVLHALNLVCEKFVTYEGLLWFLFLRP